MKRFLCTLTAFMLLFSVTASAEGDNLLTILSRSHTIPQCDASFSGSYSARLALDTEAAPDVPCSAIDCTEHRLISDFVAFTKNFNALHDDEVPLATCAVAPASMNASLKYDVNALIKNQKVYFFLPCTADLTNLTVASCTSEGEIVTLLENIDFTANGKESMWINGQKHSLVVVKSKIPSLIFNINEDYGTIADMNSCPTHDTKCYGDVTLEVTDELSLEKGWEGFESVENDEAKNGTMEIKGRGNTTWTWEDPSSKKPYQFKLEKKTDILGMGKHKTWIILKNDEYVIKNKLGLDMGIEMGIPYTSSSEFVDVFMNGEYLGLYLLCEKVEIDDTRVDISDLDKEFENNDDSVSNLDLTGGYLLEVDCWDDPLQILHTSSGNQITIKAPEDLNETVTDTNEYSYISLYMKDWLNAVYTNGKMSDGTSYLDRIDVTSFLNYFFHQEFLTNYDCGRSSTYMFKDKDSVDPKLYAGPIWDSDRIFEIMEHPEGWVVPNISQIGSSDPTLYNQLASREDFAVLLVSHYENSNLKDIFANSYKKIDEYVSYIGVSAHMNSIRWDYPYLNLDWMKNYMVARAQWIDDNYKTLLDMEG